MKKLSLLILFVLPLFLKAQSIWTQNTINDKAFISNEGQFDGRNWQKNTEIKYVSKQNGWFTFFTEKGLTYRLEKLTRNPNRKNGGHEGPSRVHISELIHVTWLNANPNVEVIAHDKTDHYYTYSAKDFKDSDISKRTHVDGYKKLVYKNIYNNIDVEYTFHPDGGIKYNLILHPGANPADIKLQYKTDHTNYLNEGSSIALTALGNLEITTSLGKIIEHQPYTFYTNSNQEINSRFEYSNNILSFSIDQYNTNEEIIIDPWVVSPAFDDGDFTREVETDAAGNVFVIGGETPMELRKYNSAGTLQWTYATPWDTVGGDWLGTLATDDAGTSFITQGTGAEIERVDDLGATYNVAWHQNNNDFGVEYWSITFNCDNSNLIVGGTKSSSPLSFPLNFWATIYDIDINSGNVNSSVSLDTSSFGPADPFVTPVEVRSISSTRNSRYLFLTHEEVGAINQDFSACNSSVSPSFTASNTESLGYKCENFLSASQNGGGLKAIVANDNYFYTHKGDEIIQWDINTGAIVNTAAIPNGSSQSVFGSLIVHCSGLDVDAAGNVYAGSMDRVVKFDANLNILSQIPTTGGFTVYDVSVNSNGEVIAGGAIQDNGTSTGRGGRIEAINMSAGGQYTLVCCNTNFCTFGPLCTSDGVVTLEASQAGGTWSISPNTPALNAGAGTFDPSLATAGTYTLTYTLGCGFSSFEFVVADCVPLEVCVESNGDLTVSGGAAPFNWDEGETIPTCTSGFANFCGPLTAQGPDAFTWTGFASGTTVTPNAGIDTVRITDGFGTELIINGLGSLPACNAVWDATITQAGPFCDNDSPVTLSAAETGGTWSGTGITNPSTGAFDPATAGAGSHVIDYTLGCGDNDTMTIVVNPTPNTGVDSTLTLCPTDPSTDLFNYLGPLADIGGTWSPVMNSTTGVFDPSVDVGGTYTYALTNGCGTSSNEVVVTVTANPDPGTNGTATVCAGAASFNLLDSLNGTPDAGGTWSPLPNSGTGIFDPSNDVGGTYTYTLNACGGGTLTAEVVVTLLPSQSPGSNGTAELCDNAGTINLIDSLGGSPDAGGTWSPLLNSGTDTFDPSIDTSGTYTYSVTGCDGNPLTADVVVTVNPSPNTGIDGSLTTCPTDPSTDLFGELGGTPETGGTWSPTMNSGTGVFDPAFDTPGTYTYSITNSCGTSSNEVLVNVTANPDPGTNGTATICDNAGTINLLDSLNGTPDAGGTWSPLLNSGTDTFDPSIDTSGTYTYSVNACGGGTLTADVVVTVNPSPNTGADGTLTLCPTDPATDLFNELGGSPDAGGTWSPIMNSGTGVFDPAFDAAGTYTYTITNTCGTSSNDVVVTVTPSLDPGTNGTATLCDNAGTINLLDSLNGTPDAGGTWSPLLNSGTDTFDPSVDTSGTYTYSVNACGGGTLSADVVVTINPSPNTGADGTLTLCPTDPATDLFNELGGSPDAGGTWSPIMNSGTGVFDPAFDAAGTYTYTITNTCGTSSNDVVVTISTNPDPGTNGTAITCSNGTAFNLMDSLNGTPDAGGTWSPALISGTNIFDPTVDAAGTYTYAVNACGGGTLSADVVITVNPAPNAGTDGSLTACPTDAATDLFGLLTGSPDVGGTWTPAMNSGTGVFDPAQDAAGTYTYTVTNSCGTDNSTVSVTVNACTIPTASFSTDKDTICAGDCIVFTDQSTSATSWQWTFNGGNPSSSIDQNPGSVCFDTDGVFNIELVATNSFGSNTYNSTVVVTPTPVISAGADVVINLNESTQLNATGVTNGVYTWSPPTWLDCTVCPSPISTPDETITYTVVVADSNGCVATDDVTVFVEFENVIFVPNIFSPNGDNMNDVLYVRGKGVAELKFFIYDRWGEKVFETTSLDNGWDGTFRGKKMNKAVFVYYLEATFVGGEEVTQKGDITLVK